MLSRRPPAQATAIVQSWGADPVGSQWIDNVVGRNFALLSGFTYPTPAGMGLAGSFETTDQHIWASPQAFNAGGGKNAFSTWHVGADAPTVYPVEGNLQQVLLPGPGGV